MLQRSGTRLYRTRSLCGGVGLCGGRCVGRGRPWRAVGLEDFDRSARLSFLMTNDSL